MAVRYIKESFSDEFPDWLVKAMNKPFGKEIKAGLSKAGIDLANAKYYPGELSGSRDAKLKDDGIANVFLFSDGTIYIPGINKPYIYTRGFEGNIDRMSWKKIIDNAVDYGFIKKNDPNLAQKRADRRDAKKGVISRGKGQYHAPQSKYISGHYDDNGEWVNSETVPDGWKWVMTRGQDKSGYPLNPSKYKDMLDDVGLNNYATRLQKYYDKIEQCRNDLAQLFTDIDFKSVMDNEENFGWGNSIYDGLSDCTRALDSAIRNYKELNRNIQRSLRDADEQGWDKDKVVKHQFQWGANSIRNDIDRLKKSMNDVKEFMHM